MTWHHDILFLIHIFFIFFMQLEATKDGAVWWTVHGESVECPCTGFLQHTGSCTHKCIYICCKLQLLHQILNSDRLNVLMDFYVLKCSQHVYFLLQYYNNMTSMLFEDLPALFGPPLPRDGFMVRASNWWRRKKIDVRYELYKDFMFLYIYDREFWWSPSRLMAVLQWTLLSCHHLLMPTPLNLWLSSNATIAILISRSVVFNMKYCVCSENLTNEMNLF